MNSRSTHPSWKANVFGSTLAAAAMAMLCPGGSDSVAAERAPAPSVYYVAPNGNDHWSGTKTVPVPGGADGPFATLGRARDAVAQLRNAFHAPIPAFLISGDILPERLSEAQASGHHLLHKPVGPMTLRTMMSRLLKDGP